MEKKTVVPTQKELSLLTALTLLELALQEIQESIDDALEAIERGTFLSLN